jgi:protein TonB
MTLLMNAVKPAYPVLARQTNVQGIVVLDADISEAGTVESVRVISGHPLLIQAALDAAQQWRYKPYMQNGKPVAMNTPISVKFTLR